MVKQIKINNWEALDFLNSKHTSDFVKFWFDILGKSSYSKNYGISMLKLSERIDHRKYNYNITRLSELRQTMLVQETFTNTKQNCWNNS